MKKYILGFALAFTLIITGCSPDKPAADSKNTVRDAAVTGDLSSGQVKEDGSVSNGTKGVGPDEVKPDSNESDFIYVLGDDDCRITGYKGKSSEVRVPDKIKGKPVTTINSGAFLRNNEIIKVIIPDSVTMIGIFAFYECSALESVEIPDSVTYIGDFAFAFCPNLSSVAIPGSAKWIGNSAFFKCTGLTNVTIGEGVQYIALHAFRGCTSLTDLSLPDSLETIDDHAFANCDLRSEEAIEKIKSINPKAFERYLFD
ncbi:MAG: leucine-rich repeat domain-containing protein [Clostridiaceae bacterium]|nr:leucine-rich repeat domain-containing protein [Clostridiaceae bacterium]